MEAIIALIGAIIVLWLIYLLIVHVIAPISGILAVVALTCGMLYALVTSTIGFMKSLLLHKDPYTTYVDKHKEAASGIKRNYYFGPGYHQIAVTIRDAFENQRSSIVTIKDWVEDFRLDHPWYINIWANLFYFAALICTYVFGTIWTASFSILLFSVISVGMVGFYIFFTVLWLTDRATLIVRSVQSRCPNCKRISIVPVFCCPGCGVQHVNLTPGPYGVLNLKCSCGSNLPTTIFNGRSRLEALCPYCQTSLAASNARQFGIQMIGGVSSGKTTFLTAYWHLYIEKLRGSTGLEYECFPQESFDELEYWFWNGLSLATSETNANMYSVVHKRPGSIPYQMTIYDVAGEAFEDMTNDIQQQQLRYCEGLIFIVDPTVEVEANSTPITGFVGEFKKLRGTHTSKLSEIPVAVVISKADLFKREIGLPKIKSVYNAERGTEEAAPAYDTVRDDICRNFLQSHGFGAVLNILESEFMNLHFFSTSAIGHSAAEGDPYSPWGVLEPVDWIMTKCGVQF